jgi:hypothetical protein
LLIIGKRRQKRQLGCSWKVSIVKEANRIKSNLPCTTPKMYNTKMYNTKKVQHQKSTTKSDYNKQSH